ncbi:hypothetical protein FQK07_03405 [Synechococcus sp. BSF8S]|uniref:hypothetical protein n=1 Tax=Synechococcales TaxID=1890424 RepID=UPI00162446AF|nr:MULTISPECIES: hypothetical protein [unclassified Synechococcus]MBC1260323.1 hypothetical protein [Synechococcus sp. BSF8S]MBC1263694.1 hypothetical protein [Synechococcus sp. BSA11S]
MKPSGFDQAYKSVELAYSQGRFEEALRQGQELLQQAQLKAEDPHSLRLKLLLGHIHFYGLRQPREAGDLYRQLLRNASGESTYSDLAAEGLALCEPSGPATGQGMAPPSLAPAPPDAGLEAELGQDEDTSSQSVEPVRVEVLSEPPGTGATTPSEQPRFSSEEEAELAKGLLRVVLR